MFDIFLIVGIVSFFVTALFYFVLVTSFLLHLLELYQVFVYGEIDAVEGFLAEE